MKKKKKDNCVCANKSIAQESHPFSIFHSTKKGSEH